MQDIEDASLYAEIATPVKPKAMRRVKRKKKAEPYVSPFRRPQHLSAEVVCVECKLPSAKGLPPFIGTKRFISGELVRTLRHEVCPSEPEALFNLITRARADRREFFSLTNKVVPIEGRGPSENTRRRLRARRKR